MMVTMMMTRVMAASQEGDNGDEEDGQPGEEEGWEGTMMKARYYLVCVQGTNLADLALKAAAAAASSSK